MADPLQPVVPGQTVRLTAAAWNEFLSGAARARRLERLGGEAQTAPPVPSVILLKNTSNAAVDRHGVLSIASVAPLVTPTTSTPVFESAVALEGDLPAAAGERFAIMLDPLPATNSIGRAAVGGMVQALVNVSNTSHAYATTVASNTVALASNASHGAPIVWREAGTGVKWSIIALPAQHGGSGAIDGTLTNGTIPVATDPDTVGDSYLSQAGNTIVLASNKTLSLPAATTTVAPLIIPHGTAPSSASNGSIWTTTAGLFVQIAGAATAIGSAPVDPSICQGRLTASSSDPVGETFGATLYFLPFGGNSVALYDGAAWELHTFTSVSISNSGLSDGSVYDVFLYDNAGTLTLELLVWTNTTTRATALVRQDGVWVKTGATTRRYIGTVYIPTGTNFTDLANTPQRWIWNYYNRVWREMSVQETEDSHDYTTATWRQYSNDSTNKVEFVIGVSENDVEAEAAATFVNTSEVWAAVGIGVSSTSANSARFHGTSCAANQYAKDVAKYRGRPGIGYQYLAWLEISEAVGTTTWHNSFFVSDVRGGLMAGLWC